MAERSSKWALLIGIDDYHESLGSLKYAGADCRTLRDVLVSGPLGFPEDQVLLLHDTGEADHRPTFANIHSHLGSWLAAPKEDDLVFVYFAGHGRLLDGKNYLVPGDATLSSLHTLGIQLSHVQDVIENCKASRKLLVLDACHSGSGRDVTAMPDQMQEALAQGTGFYTISSCGADELSHEWDEKGHGVFSHYLVEALQGGCSPNADGRLTVDRVYEWTHDNVTKWAAQHRCKQSPQRYSAGAGTFVFAQQVELLSPRVTNGGATHAREKAFPKKADTTDQSTSLAVLIGIVLGVMLVGGIAGGKYLKAMGARREYAQQFHSGMENLPAVSKGSGMWSTGAIRGTFEGQHSPARHLGGDSSYSFGLQQATTTPADVDIAVVDFKPRVPVFQGALIVDLGSRTQDPLSLPMVPMSADDDDSFVLTADGELKRGHTRYGYTPIRIGHYYYLRAGSMNAVLQPLQFEVDEQDGGREIGVSLKFRFLSSAESVYHLVALLRARDGTTDQALPTHKRGGADEMGQESTKKSRNERYRPVANSGSGGRT